MSSSRSLKVRNVKEIEVATVIESSLNVSVEIEDCISSNKVRYEMFLRYTVEYEFPFNYTALSSSVLISHIVAG